MSAETVAATNALGHFLAGLSNQPARPLADIRLRKAAYAIDRGMLHTGVILDLMERGLIHVRSGAYELTETGKKALEEERARADLLDEYEDRFRDEADAEACAASGEDE